MKEKQELESSETVAIDECGIETDIHRENTRSPKGTIIYKQPTAIQENWYCSRTCQITQSGKTAFCFSIYYQNCDSDLFYAWLEQMLIPQIK